MFAQNVFVLTTLLFSAAAAQAAPVLTLTPSGNVVGLPGNTVGWGFSITNDSGYIEITSAQFCLDPLALPACSLPTIGTFNDFISAFGSVVVGPPGGTLPETVSQAFDAVLFRGVGSFDIAPGATMFTSNFGQIVLTYNVFDADPNSPAGANEIFTGQTMTASAFVNVDRDLVSTQVPEPSALALASAGLALLWKARRNGHQ